MAVVKALFWPLLLKPRIPVLHIWYSLSADSRRLLKSEHTANRIALAVNTCSSKRQLSGSHPTHFTGRNGAEAV